ncbi:MAG: M15 family metallopeptidase [Treponemataceae bacterium]|nr:M15 family metallopeptidase [Treponemataceae bacterium]
MMRVFRIAALAAFCLASAGCRKNGVPSSLAQPPEPVPPQVVKFRLVYGGMDERFRSEVSVAEADIPEFVSELEAVIAADTENLLRFCSKQKLLPSTYAPEDLVPVKSNSSYVVNRNDLSLRKTVADNLAVLGDAAKADGITLSVSSTYRSYQYQERLYARNVAELGQEAADRESARPGSSQHQLGVVVDFGSVTDEFAETPAGLWLSQNAERYGWSLSFPKGYEDVTGFRWECWQYRYLGDAACSLQKKWFHDIQHFMLEFIDAWKGV